MAEYFDFERVETVKQVIQFLQEPLGRSVLGNYILFACLLFFNWSVCTLPRDPGRILKIFTSHPQGLSPGALLSSPGQWSRPARSQRASHLS